MKQLLKSPSTLVLMEGMGWTLSTFRVLIAVSGLFFVCGCSSKKASFSFVKSFLKGKPTPKSPKQKPKKIITGPTSPSNKYFVDVTKEIGLSGVRAHRLYAVDFTSDGYTDLVTLASHYSVPDFYVFNPQKKKFVLIKESPFSEVVRASFMAFADFNKDNIMDVLVGNINQKTELTTYPLRIFKGTKKSGVLRFIEAKGAFSDRIDPTASVGLLDFDLDGNLDVYVGNWFDLRKKETPVSRPDRLYRSKKGFIFEDRSDLLKGELIFSRSLNVHPNAVPTSGVSICDIDQNGYPDILTSSASGFGNKLWISRPAFKSARSKRIYKDYGKTSGFWADEKGGFNLRGGGNSTYSKCADYNNDGIMDLAVGEIFHSYDRLEKDRSGILTGKKANFPPEFLRTSYDKEKGSKSWSQGDRRGIWIDFNGDSLLDLLVENSGFPPSTRLNLFKQNSDHSFEEKAKSLGIDVLNPAGAITMDFDRDGKLDIIVGQTTLRGSYIKPRIYAFKNMVSSKGTWYKFYFQGKSANRSALGGLVIIKTNKRSYRRPIEYIYGPFPSQNEEGISLALGQNEKIEFVEMRWPFLKKDRSGRYYPLVRFYRNINKLSDKGGMVNVITLCESGKWQRGKRRCP